MALATARHWFDAASATGRRIPNCGFQKQQRCSEQRPPQEPVLTRKKGPGREWRCERQSHRRGPPNDEVHDGDTAGQGCDVPSDECVSVGQQRKRNQHKEKHGWIRPIRVDVIPRSDQCLLDLRELHGIVEQGGVAVQRLHPGQPRANEIAVDRQTPAVDDPKAALVEDHEQRRVERGEAVAIGLQPPGCEYAEAARG